VLAVESMLYNFNMQCKFMMPSKHLQLSLQSLEWFSLHRAAPAGLVPASNVVMFLSPKEADKKGLEILLKYFSVPSVMVTYFLQLTKKDRAPDLTLG